MSPQIKERAINQKPEEAQIKSNALIQNNQTPRKKEKKEKREALSKNKSEEAEAEAEMRVTCINQRTRLLFK